MLQIAIRADASVQMGTGHLMRCLTLADELKKVGAVCTFVCRPHVGNMIDTIEQRGHSVLVLPEVQSEFKSTPEDTAHANWLGTDWKTDALETARHLGDQVFDWLIVDHYSLDIHWEKCLRPSYQNLMVIDDLADRQHECDLLLDQNYGSTAERYAGLVPADCIQFYGPEFALLKPIYAQRRAEQSVRSGKIERVLIYFGGGADPMNLTGMALRAFQAPELKRIELDIVVGSSYEHKEELEAAAATRSRTRIHAQLPDLSELMARADLAIGASGATTWERCCLGLPSILVVCALNQEAIGEAMRMSGAAIVFHADDNLAADVKEQVVDLCLDTVSCLRMSDKAKRICDGLGVSRVSKEIISTSKTIVC